MSASVVANRLAAFLKWPSQFQTSTMSTTWSHIRHCSLMAFNQRKTNNDVFQTAGDDLSDITPNFRPSYNIGAYVNRSETLQNLVKLNVNLSKIEKKPFIVEKFLKLDFEKDMKKHIVFISNYIDMEHIGDFITKNPMIFYEDLEDMKVRINYLVSKGFDEIQIKRIVSKNPYWLMFKMSLPVNVVHATAPKYRELLTKIVVYIRTLRIDKRLGYFQQCFELNGKEVRYLATRKPTLITYNLHHIKTNTFTIQEEMGFETREIKAILMDKPKIWMLTQRALLERFQYIHNTMKISHNTIAKNPEVLLSRVHRIKERHLFLEKLGRAQYDPKKENYIPITALIKDTDVEFCQNYAKCNVDDYNLFLKTQ